MEEEVKCEGKIGAKACSRVSMIVASVWVAAGTVLKGLGVIKMDETDIIYSAVAIVGIWSPAYLSIWLDKIKEIRFGK